jgi:hypothetical protein
MNIKVIKCIETGEYLESYYEEYPFTGWWYLTNDLSKAMETLCREELIYFKNAYYNRIKEELICDLLNMSRDSLRRIKESCIIKIAMYFDIDVMATDK